MIKNRIKYILAYVSIILVIFYLSSCSDLDTNIPPPPYVNVHGEGIDSIDSPNWHGNLVKQYNYNLMVCQDCHGTDYSGGLVDKSCLGCHVLPLGPENCTTCHGTIESSAPPRDLNGNISNTAPGVGFHQNHLRFNTIGRQVLCSECHNVPPNIFSPGHIDSDQPAELLFNGPRGLTLTNEPNTAHYDASLPLFEPDPIFDYSALTCSNTYCHGYFKNGNLDNVPVWNEPLASECGTCHGNGVHPLPKTQSQGGTHPSNSNCYQCHGGVINEDMQIINPDKHLDGLLNLYGSDINF